MFLELFAGKGALSRALRQLGFEVHSFEVPMLQLDLASEKEQAWNFLSTFVKNPTDWSCPDGSSEAVSCVSF